MSHKTLLIAYYQGKITRALKHVGPKIQELTATSFSLEKDQSEDLVQRTNEVLERAIAVNTAKIKHEIDENLTEEEAEIALKVNNGKYIDIVNKTEEIEYNIHRSSFDAFGEVANIVTSIVKPEENPKEADEGMTKLITRMSDILND